MNYLQDNAIYAFPRLQIVYRVLKDSVKDTLWITVLYPLWTEVNLPHSGVRKLSLFYSKKVGGVAV